MNIMIGIWQSLMIYIHKTYKYNDREEIEQQPKQNDNTNNHNNNKQTQMSDDLILFQ